MTAFPSLSTFFGYRRILKVDARQILRESLVMERIFQSRRVQHVFEIPYPYLTTTQKVEVATFFVTCRGRILGDIAYTDPWDSIGYTCRLDMDTLELDSLLSHWTGTLRLVEVASFKALKAAVATFPATVPFQPPYRTFRQYSTVVNPQEDFSELRYEDWASSIRRWGCGGHLLTQAQANALLDCWEGNCGPYRAFDFTEPPGGGEAVSSHFVEGECVHTIVTNSASGPFSDVRLTVEELK